MRSRRIRVLAAVAVAGVLLLLAPPRPAAAAQPWWQPVALLGTPLTAVAADGSTLTVRTQAGQTMQSRDGGASFAVASAAIPLGPSGVVVSGRDRWGIDAAGRVLHATGGGSLQPDPGAPRLGRFARLIAAPAAAPGVVVAVATDGTVWRRGQDGDWKVALVLLPTGFPGGVPAVTDVAAFTEPLTVAVYLSTDGYSVLDSTDGGDDWIRAGPGLPSAVYALAADSPTKSLYAATSNGLWVHVLRSFPAPPAYKDAALLWRWIGIALISVVSGFAAALALRRLLAGEGGAA